MATILESYLLEPSLIETGDTAIWKDQTAIIGANPSNTTFSYVDSPEKNYTTDLFVSRFDDVSRKEFLNTYEAYEVVSVKYYIRFRIFSAVPGVDAEISLHMSLALGGSVLPYAPTYASSTYGGTEVGVKTAVVTFDLTTGVPSRNDLLTTDSLYARFGFSASDMDADTQSIYVYEILQVIEMAEIAGPTFSMSFNGAPVQSTISVDLGSFERDSEVLPVFVVQNTGADDLVIDTFEILGSGIKEVSSSILPITLAPTMTEQIFVKIDTDNEGEFEDQRIKISNNSTNQPAFFLSLSFKIDSPSQTDPPIVAPFYGSTQIVNNRSLAIASAPLNIARTASILFYNQGGSNLTVSGVTVTGDATIGAGTTLITGAVIAPLGYATLNLSLVTSTLSNKAVSVNVSSNDAINNPFSFALTYSVLPHSNLIFSSDSSDLTDGADFDVGSIDKGKSYTKSYILTNSGVYKNLTIDSFTASDDLSIVGTYSLPFTLAPNSANSLVITVLFDTLTVGLKDGIFTINYSEGSVPS